MEVLGYPDMTFDRLATLCPDLRRAAPEVEEQLEIEARYSGYLQRQEADVKAYRRDESWAIPTDLDFDQVGGLTTEVRYKLTQARPATLGAAGRIPGITPAAITALMGHIRKSMAAAKKAG